MDCPKVSLSDSGPSEFSDTNRLTGSSTVEPKSKSLNNGSNKENKVRKRTTYSEEQLQELHKHFNQTVYLDSPQIGYISRRLGITRRQVRKWFQNMRMKKKKEKNGLVHQFQSSKTCDPSVVNPSRTQGVGQPDVALQQVSSINTTTHPTERDNQSWDYFSHLHKQQKTVGFPNGYYQQAPAVPTYFSPYLEPHTFQPNNDMNQSWNMSSLDILPQQQNRGNYQASPVYGYPEASSLTSEHKFFTQL
ncbi:uncharacterized protein [Notamacropus eugenii]|uniref:uncharacterized protein n=1 Tax=Notamacropus eugenii TaxID=9315 RepID=UPI003B683D5D